MSTTVPFSLVDEAVFNIERKFTPWNVHLELESTTSVDVERLREAAVTAADAHPLSRARRRSYSELDTEYVWEIPDGIESVPIETSRGDQFSDRRSEFYGEPFDLTAAPPFRLLVGRGEGVAGGDRLLLSASHVAADGVGALRLLRSICQAYRGERPGEDPVDLETSRAVFDELRPSDLGRRAELLGAAASHLGKLIDRPTRLAEDGATDRLEWDFAYRELDEEVTESLLSDRPSDASVNDVLLAAHHLAIDRWNADRGEPAEKITITMPVNLRPDEWFYDVVGMYVLFESVVTRPRHRTDPRSTLERVVDQTTAIKERDRATAFLESLALVPGFVPVGVKRRSPELLRGPGRRFVDTAMLSNLGRVPEPLPALEGDEPDALWFSPPSWRPTPLSIGVVTMSGSIRLVFRHLRTTLDNDAANRFADRYLAALEELLA